jgi:hypothetical protein
MANANSLINSNSAISKHCKNESALSSLPLKLCGTMHVTSMDANNETTRQRAAKHIQEQAPESQDFSQHNL